MKKYLGRYKLEYERDTDNNVLEGENVYIPCKKGGQIYRFNDNTLVLYLKSKIKAKNIQKLQQENIVKVHEGDAECDIYFKEGYIDEFASLAGAYIQGKSKMPKKYTRKYDNSVRYRVLHNGKVIKNNLALIQVNVFRKENENIYDKLTVEKYTI